MSANLKNLKVFVFPGQFGLPTLGPFALKLEAWLRVMGIDYERVVEANPAKGPKGKNPWIEYNDVRMGDTELIIKHLEQVTGKSLDDWHSNEQAGIALAAQRLIEEHLHQIFEYELMVMDDGWKYLKQSLQPIPAPLRGLIGYKMRSHFKQQLLARGIGRHTPEVITAKGKADLDALSRLLGEKTWLIGDQPSTVDMSLYGMVAPMVFSPIKTPVMEYARSLNNITDLCKRIRAEYFDKG